MGETGRPVLAAVGSLPSRVLPLVASNAISSSRVSTKVSEATFSGDGSLSGGIPLDAAAVDTKLKDSAMDLEWKAALEVGGDE
jgi:hypothetical protein